MKNETNIQYPVSGIKNSASKILIIDDEQIVTETIRKDLDGEGYEVISAINGKEGLDIFEKEHPILIILDLRMPVMDGITFLEHIKLKPSSIFSVIVLTGHGDNEDIKKSFTLGVSSFLSKPYNVLVLRGMVKHSIEAKQTQLRAEYLASFPRLNINPILEIDFSGAITFCNKATMEVLDKLGIKNTDINVFLPEDMNIILNTLEQKKDKQLYREVQIRDHIFLEDIHPVAEFDVVRIYTRDITEVKQKDIALAKIRMELLHSEKLSAIGKLSASIAHELNNPICGIRNVLDTIKERYACENIDKNEKKLISMAIVECNRIATLIENLRDFYRPSSDIKSMIDIHEIIDEMEMLCKKKFKKMGIVFEKHYADEIPKIKVVQDQFKQVILNLLQNAEEAIVDSGGKITITTERVHSTVLIQVKDTGCGIPSEFMSNIFEPFFTSKSMENGTGLGLSICYGIIKKHKWDIKVESKEGKGTTFCIIIPIKDHP